MAVGAVCGRSRRDLELERLLAGASSRGRCARPARPRVLGRFCQASAAHQGGAGRRSGRAAAVRHEPHPPAGPLRARLPDLGYHGPSDPMARDRGVVGVVGALLGLRFSSRGAGTERPPLLPVLVRPVRRLLGRARRRAGPRRVGHPGRRPGLTDAAPRDPGARRHRARLHAVIRPPPGRAGARPGHRSGGRSAFARRSTPGSRGPASPPCGSVSRCSGAPRRTTTRG